MTTTVPGTTGAGGVSRAGGPAVPGEVRPLSAVQIAELTGKPRPTPEQQRVIEAPLVPALVVAGAGSGKTETMAARVVWLLANALVAPEQVLGLTFTRKAAGELGERVRSRVRLLVRCAAQAGVLLPGGAALGGGPGGGGPGAGVLDGLARPTISTYNAYAASLVADHALRIGLDPSARLLGEAAQWQLASEVVEAWDDDLGTQAAVSTVVEAVLTLSGALDEHLLGPAQARAGIEAIVEGLHATPAGTPPRRPYADIATLMGSLGERTRLLDVVEQYRARKRAADAIDFGDQVALAARLARDVPEVGAAERERFAVVLLDEYQDTSYAQLTLLSALFGGGHAVTAVGDPHQSIYGWRGASAGGLEDFPTSFPTRGPAGPRPADVHLLSTSWRNDAAILEAANHVAGPLRSDAARVPVPVLAARPEAGPGRVLAHVAETLEDEARTVAEFVAERWRPSTHPQGRVTAAVLCRKRAQFEPLRRALRARGLPVEVVGLGGLLASPEVVDLVAALQAAHDPTRGDALMRLLTGARTRLGAADLHALGAWAAELAGRAGRVRGTGPGNGPGGGPGDAVVIETDAVDERSIVDALDDLPRPGWRSSTGRTLTDTARGRLHELAALLRTLRAHAYLAVPELVTEAERVLGLDIEVTARAGTSPGRARAQLDAFRDVAAEFARTSDHPTLGGFLAWLEAADARENGLEMPVTEPDADAVQIITIHAAKGLEWDVVAVAGLVDGGLPATPTGGKDGPKDSAWLVGLGRLPYPLRGDRAHLPDFAYAGAADPKDLEERRRRFVLDAGDHQVAEERRLAYVALTRARTDLLLTAAWWGDGSRPRRLSLFLTELAEAGLVDPHPWCGAPEPDADNPRAGLVVSATWPADPFGDDESGVARRAALERSARWVREAVAARGGRLPRGLAGRPDRVEPAELAESAELDESAEPGAVGTRPGGAPLGWEQLAERLLAERNRARATTRDVDLPAHLSASALVRLGSDAQEFARGLRRPVPQEPSVQARIGTQFHAWVEGYFGSAALVDVDALPGAEDGADADVDRRRLDVDVEVARLRESFLTTPWAGRVPVAIEVDVETNVDGYVLRSRIDAVFPDPRTDARARDGAGTFPREATSSDDAAGTRPDGAALPAGRVVVVDWKTGAPPTDPQVRASREIQLAVYRLAWSRWAEVPLADVSAAFCYVGAGETVYPERLLDADEIIALLRSATSADDGDL